MCGLYVMDWYNRTYVYNHQLFPRPDPDSEIGNIFELTNWIPPAQPLVRPLLSTCMGILGASCPTYCCASILDADHGLVDGNGTLTDDLLLEELDNSSPKPLASGVGIRLLDLNLSLDAKYCVDNSCMPRKGRYNLYVPMSAYMPIIPVHIRFR